MDGTKRLLNLFTVANEHCQVLDQSPTSGVGRSCDGLNGDIGSAAPLLKDLVKRYDDDRELFDLFYSDNCCHDRNEIERHVSHINMGFERHEQHNMGKALMAALNNQSSPCA